MNRLLICLLLCGCVQAIPPQKVAPLPSEDKAFKETSSIVVSVPASDLQGIQKYVGDGNTVTLSDKTEVSFGDTVLSAPAGTNVTYANKGDSIVLTFGSPLPVVTVRQWGLSFHPKLERLVLDPDGSVSATVNELGRRITKEGVFRWAEEQPKQQSLLSPDKVLPRTSLTAPSPVLIPFAQTGWVETHSGRTSAHHLVAEHGCPQWVADYYSSSPALLTQIHSGYHERARGGPHRMLLVSPPEKPSAKSSFPTQNCPTGNCPTSRR